MAIIPLVINSSGNPTWSGLNAGDTGAPMGGQNLPDKTFQFIGTVSSATVEGSMDGVNYTTLTTVDGSPAALSEAGFLVIRENPVYIRPNVATGTAVKVIASAEK